MEYQTSHGYPFKIWLTPQAEYKSQALDLVISIYQKTTDIANSQSKQKINMRDLFLTNNQSTHQLEDLII
jgi:hypothetical protein